KRHLAEALHVGGIDRSETLAVGGRDPFAPDIEAARGEIERRGVHAVAQGTIAARSTLRSEAFLNAMSRSFRANLESTMLLKGNRVRFAITKSSAWIRWRG